MNFYIAFATTPGRIAYRIDDYNMTFFIQSLRKVLLHIGLGQQKTLDEIFMNVRREVATMFPEQNFSQCCPTLTGLLRTVHIKRFYTMTLPQDGTTGTQLQPSQIAQPPPRAQPPLAQPPPQAQQPKPKRAVLYHTGVFRRGKKGGG